MKRYVFFAYSLVCYALFGVACAALFVFLAPVASPLSIDRAAPGVSPSAAALVDTLLIVAFGLQHSVMARPAFKRWWTQFVPHPIERATYVLASVVVTLALVLFWQPIDVVLWKFESGAGWWLLTGLYVAGFLLVPTVTMMISHFDLFGLRQTWCHLRGKPCEPLPFATPGLYRWLRHPLYVGWAIAFCATPAMTLGHLLFATLMCGYMLVAVGYEERDLITHFGQQYVDYMRRTPRFWPRLFAGAANAGESPEFQPAGVQVPRGEPVRSLR